MTKEERQQIAEALIGARSSINAALKLLHEQSQQPVERKKPLTFGEPNPEEDDGA